MVCGKAATITEKFRVALERLRFTFTANGKRQTNVENFSE